MRDADGRTMLDELSGQLHRLGAHIADVADALGLTTERIRGEMTARGYSGASGEIVAADAPGKVIERHIGCRMVTCMQHTLE